MDMTMVKTIFEIIGLLFIPVIAWLLNTVSQHGKKIILLEERVNDSINRRLTGLETKFDAFEDKLDKINVNSVKSASWIEQLDKKIDGIMKVK
jgi:uncharacterized coiled-coil protein SlyX